MNHFVSFMKKKKEMKRSLDNDNEEELGERIAKCCFDKFNELSARGKPSANEWTHLAAFLSIDCSNNQIDILSLGTGTKCLGGQVEERGTNGCLLHDSHAEVIARRAFIRFLYEQILEHNTNNQSILIQQKEKEYIWNESLKICLFVSYSPCGSAAFLSDPIKRPKLEHKSLNSSLYFKPGKGHQTTSLSCSNKINRWICQGLQGSLLDQIIIKPIRLSSLIIHSNIDLSSIFPDVSVQSIDQPFAYGRFSSQRVRPCSMSIAWWKSLDVSSPIVTVDGHPLGQVNKLRHKQQYASPIAKCSLFKLYLQIFDNLPSTTTTYAQAKQLSKNELTKKFFEKNDEWLRSDPNIFYSFSLVC